MKKSVPVAIDGFHRDQKSHKLVECGGDAMMGCGSTHGGGGYFGLEQFVSYDPADDDSIDGCVKHMEDAVEDCKKHGIPLGKEFMYLQMGWPHEKVWDALAKMPQQFVLEFQSKIKKALDPNSLGDRNYQWLPDDRLERPGVGLSAPKPLSTSPKPDEPAFPFRETRREKSE